MAQARAAAEHQWQSTLAGVGAASIAAPRADVEYASADDHAARLLRGEVDGESEKSCLEARHGCQQKHVLQRSNLIPLIKEGSVTIDLAHQVCKERAVEICAVAARLWAEGKGL